MKARIVVVAVLLGAFSPAVTLGELLGDDFRISFQQGSGDPAFGARVPAAAYNSTDHEYLVVWEGDSQPPFPECPPNSPREREIFGQRVDAASGMLLGPAFRVSRSGPSCDGVHRAFMPAAAYNASDNEYLVVWHGDNEGGGLVDDEFEIFGRRVDSGGAPIGADDFRISDMGGTGDTRFAALDAAVAWNALLNQYLVVWSGDDGEGDLVDDEFEVYGQFLNAAGGEIGDNDFRISDAGGDGGTDFGVSDPAVAWNSTANQYLVVWEGSDKGPGARELEIFGQRIAADGRESGANDFRISFQQGSGDTSFRAKLPAIAYHPNAGEYLVVWQGDFEGAPPTCPLGSPKEQEIFGQRLDGSTGMLLGTAPAISRSGPACDNTHRAFSPAASYDAATGNYLIVWFGDQDTGGLVNDEFEIFGRRVGANGLPIGGADFRISEMGGTGNPSFDAAAPALAAGVPLVVWHGDSNQGGLVNNELEIFGQRLVARIFASGFE